MHHRWALAAVAAAAGTVVAAFAAAPSPFQGEGKGEGEIRRAPRRLSPHPNPLPRGEREFLCAAALERRTEATASATTRPLTGLAKQGVFVDRERGEIALRGEVVFRDDDIIEYVCCAAGTAEHESIIAVKANPLAVRLALMLPPFRLKPGTVIRWADSGVKPPTGPKVLVFAEYRDPKTKKTVRGRAEDWILMESKDPKTGKWVRRPMRRTGFVFAGGGFFEGVRGGRRTFLANGDGAIVTTYNRISSVIDNPQKEGASDEVWFPDSKRIPPLGTKVTVILKPVLSPASQPATRPAPR